MKRLFPFLILAAFILGLAGGGVGRPHVQLKIRTCTQDFPKVCAYSPCDDPLSKWDEAEQPLSPPRSLVFFLEPSRKSLLPWNWLSPISLKRYDCLGLGCGGLPS